MGLRTQAQRMGLRTQAQTDPKKKQNAGEAQANPHQQSLVSGDEVSKKQTAGSAALPITPQLLRGKRYIS
jgi:hypothetical protein